MELQSVTELDNQSKQGTRKPRIIAAIPSYNEERFIGSVVLQTRKYVDKVLVIDDGSSDATADVASAAGATVYKHDCNRGKGAAIRTAFMKAREEEADVLVLIDGDGQHNPREITLLAQPVIEGRADVVVGSRFLGGNTRPPFYRRLGQRFLTLVSNAGSRTAITDSQSGFRAFSSRALRSLRLSENGFAVDSEIQFALRQSDLSVMEVPIQALYPEKAKRNPVVHGVNVLGRLLVLVSLRQPFVLFGIPGVACLGGGLALGIRVLDLYAKHTELAVGSLLAAIGLCLVGILALFAALMLQSMKELMRREWEVMEKTGVSTHEPGEGA